MFKQISMYLFIHYRFRTIKFQENSLYGEEFEHCEIPHSSLKLSHNIGKGAFGSVYLAVADAVGPKACSGLVAVKKLKSSYMIIQCNFVNRNTYYHSFCVLCSLCSM